MSLFKISKSKDKLLKTDDCIDHTKLLNLNSSRSYLTKKDLARKYLSKKHLTKKHFSMILSSLLLSSITVSAQADSTISEDDQNYSGINGVDSTSYSDNEMTNGIIAIVNDTPILKSDFKNALAAAKANIQASGQPIPSNQLLQNEVLNSLIMRELQLDLINRAGIRPDPNAINQSLARFAQSQGLTSLSELQQKLDARQPGSYAALREQITEEEALKTLQQSQIANRVRITEQDIDAFLKSPESKMLQSAEYRTIHMRVPFKDDVSRISQQEKQIAMKIAEETRDLLQNSNDVQSILTTLSNGVAKNYFAQVQGGDMGYHEAAGLPTEIASQITQLNEGNVTDPQVTPSGIDIVKLVDIRNNDNMIIPQWKVRHILIKSDNSNNDSLAEQKANDLYERLRRDADFASLAATYSDDPGSAGRGGDLDWVSEGQMVPEFEQIMKRTPEGDFSTPFKSQFGWHILKVEDTRQQDVSETIKRRQAREVLYQRLAPQAQEDWLQELRTNSYIRIFN